jgi:hypothetical protein
MKKRKERNGHPPAPAKRQRKQRQRKEGVLVTEPAPSKRQRKQRQRKEGVLVTELRRAAPIGSIVGAWFLVQSHDGNKAVLQRLDYTVENTSIDPVHWGSRYTLVLPVRFAAHSQPFHAQMRRNRHKDENRPEGPYNLKYRLGVKKDYTGHRGVTLYTNFSPAYNRTPQTIGHETHSVSGACD